MYQHTVAVQQVENKSTGATSQLHHTSYTRKKKMPQRSTVVPAKIKPQPV